MLKKEINGTYVAIHYVVAGRKRHPNLAVYTGHGKQWVLGLRCRVTIDAKKYPEQYEQANNVLVRIRNAIKPMRRDTLALTDWGAIDQGLRRLFMRANDDGFSTNYQWYLLSKSPEEIAGLPIRGLLR